MLRAIRHIKFGFSEICIFVKEMTTFSKDTLKSSKVTVKVFLMILKINNEDFLFQINAIVLTVLFMKVSMHAQFHLSRFP